MCDSSAVADLISLADFSQSESNLISTPDDDDDDYDDDEAVIKMAG